MRRSGPAVARRCRQGSDHGRGAGCARRCRLTFRLAGVASSNVGARGLTMPGGVKLIDSTLVIVLHNGEQEIERELASPADALRVALMMLARRERLEGRT